MLVFEDSGMAFLGLWPISIENLIRCHQATHSFCDALVKYVR
jgi:hypothetical protein